VLILNSYANHSNDDYDNGNDLMMKALFVKFNLMIMVVMMMATMATILKTMYILMQHAYS
jgi:hypothetical protein